MKTTTKGKFDRLLKILFILDERRNCGARILAERLEVRDRTIYRYVTSLKNAGFPIFYDPVKQTYAFEDGYSLKKAQLNPQETLALALARSMLKPLGSTFQDAIRSVKAKIAPPQHEMPIRLKLLQAQTGVDLSQLIADLSFACNDRRIVRLEYKTLHSEVTSTRNIEPYYLFLSPDGFWNVRAYCRMRDDWRVFSLDRMLRLDLLNRYFVPREFAQDSCHEKPEGFGSYLDGQPSKIVVRFHPSIRAFVERAKWHPSHETEILPDGWLELRFHTLGTLAVKYWLYRWIPHVRVIEPEELRKEMIQDLRIQDNLLNTADLGACRNNHIPLVCCVRPCHAVCGGHPPWGEHVRQNDS